MAETQIPPNNLENLIVDQPDDLVPPGLRAGQTLQLFDGGELPSFFTAVGAALRVNGGTVGSNLSVADSTVDISSGSIGLGLTGFQGATVNVSGGQLIFLASARAGSEFNICGGQLGGGGTFIFDVESEAVVNFSGGQLGTGYQANSGSETHFAGTEFFIDGVAVDGLELGEPVAISEREVTLSGRLQDGSEFSFDLNPIEGIFLDDFFSPDATVTITLVESLIRGDFNGDEVVNLLDVALFVDAIASGVFVPQADINKDGIVDLLDIPLFVELLVGA